MSGKDTVFVIDDDPAIRRLVACLLEDEKIEVECFASGEAFLKACRWVPRSCAIVDMSLPGFDGLQLQAELTKRGMLLPIVFLTGYGDIPLSVRAIKAGAVDFLSKPVTSAVLLASVQAALNESEKLSQRSDKKHAANALVANLTKREREVLRLAVEGLTNKVIARELKISHRTVEVYKTRIMQKTGAATLLELARLYDSSSEPGN